MSDQSILVIGASGKTGSRVANRLQALGKTVRHGTRGVTVPFDWDDPDTWPAALEGIESAYVTYFPDLAFPGAVEKVDALCSVAKEAGLCHLVLLSGRGEHHAREAEKIVEGSGLDYTLVRSSWFAQNFSEGYLHDPILAGILPMPGGDILEPIIDIDDIADVVVAALTQHGHSKQLYEVTGPELLNFSDMAQILSREIGRPIQHIPISFENFHANVAAAGGDFVADIFTAIARETLDGRNAEVCNGVQRALGRAPTSFAEFARKTALKGAWKSAA
nr:NmrA family NAD(P)-binding protein [uncultured Cohaesibacter sp.]